jgi:hypothetical protein
MQQEFPVWLVIRNSEGNIRWMEIRDYLKKVSDNGERNVGKIEFSGQRFDVMSVRTIRKEVLQLTH